MAVADADVSRVAPPRAAEIERVTTMMLLCGVALTVEDADDIACATVSVPVAVTVDALSHEPEPIKRVAKQVTRERMATGSCLFDADAPASKALDTRRAGEAVTVPAAALGDEAEVRSSTTTFGPGPAISLMTRSF